MSAGASYRDKAGDGLGRLFSFFGMREYEAFLLDALLESLRKRVSSSTYSAFEMLWIQQMPLEEVSRITRKSAGALYLIRHRCLRILRQSAAEIPEAVDRIHHKGNSTKKA